MIGEKKKYINIFGSFTEPFYCYVCWHTRHRESLCQCSGLRCLKRELAKREMFMEPESLLAREKDTEDKQVPWIISVCLCKCRRKSGLHSLTAYDVPAFCQLAVVGFLPCVYPSVHCHCRLDDVNDIPPVAPSVPKGSFCDCTTQPSLE